MSEEPKHDLCAAAAMVLQAALGENMILDTRQGPAMLLHQLPAVCLAEALFEAVPSVETEVLTNRVIGIFQRNAQQDLERREQAQRRVQETVPVTPWYRRWFGGFFSLDCARDSVQKHRRVPSPTTPSPFRRPGTGASKGTRA